MSKVFLTGAAGFIGFHLIKLLLERNYEVIGIDELNDYYDVQLKKDRLKELGIEEIDEHVFTTSSRYPLSFGKISTYNRTQIEQIFSNHKFDYVIHLAAQAGVRNSIDNPYTYTQSNIEGFLPILEGCRHNKPKHLVYASSSSVYGNSKKVPFEESDSVDNPISLYAATKKANELMAHTYSHLYDIPATGLRFFTVYGPWGRPDMAYFKFADKIYSEQPIDIYNNGDLKRDFTYIDDVVKGIANILPKELTCNPRYQILNIGNSKPVNLMDFISTLEEKLGKSAMKNYLPMQLGDVNETYASTKKLEAFTNYKPSTSLKDGLEKFADWYNSYYNIK
jgi:UDP-glucuronate 4-epimerase